MVYLSSGWWLFTNWSGLHKHEKKKERVSVLSSMEMGNVGYLFLECYSQDSPWCKLRPSNEPYSSGFLASNHHTIACLQKKIKCTVRLDQQTIQCRVECCEDSDVVGVTWQAVGVPWHLRSRLFCQVSTPDKTAGFSRLFLWCSREMTSE